MKRPLSTEPVRETECLKRQDVARSSNESSGKIDHHSKRKEISVELDPPKLLPHLNDEHFGIDVIIDYLTSGLDDLSDEILLRLEKARSAAIARKHP